MSNQPAPNAPFLALGRQLKYLREQSNQSLAEVSGAVEIDEQELNRIENGQERPAEDVLLLLISYFDMQDIEAVRMWELAGYGGVPATIKISEEVEAAAAKGVVIFMAVDLRAIYSDGVDITCNNGGVTLNFTQTNGKGLAADVSRIGMSYDQAEKVSLALQQALLKARYLKGPRALPPSDSDKSE